MKMNENQEPDISQLSYLDPAELNTKGMCYTILPYTPKKSKKIVKIKNKGGRPKGGGGLSSRKNVGSDGEEEYVGNGYQKKKQSKYKK